MHFQHPSSRLDRPGIAVVGGVLVTVLVHVHSRHGELRLPRNTRYVILAMALLLSVLTGVAAFEWVSPIGVFHREVLYGAGFGAAALFGLFVFDALVLRHGWCGHLCPLGAFWAQEAWANYWGWDSKENSALITWLMIRAS